MSDKQEREYKITKWNLWYHVYRTKKEEDWKIVRLEWLQNNSYTLNRDYAKTFYHLDTAISALSIAKFQWNTIKIDSSQGKRESEKKSEKTSWSEL